MLYQYLVGFAYLIIGLFVYFRRGSAHKARHFYILCLASFHLRSASTTPASSTFRQGDLFRQRGGRPAGAHRVPAFLPDVSRSRGHGSAEPARAVLLYVPAAAAVPGLPGVQLPAR